MKRIFVAFLVVFMALCGCSTDNDGLSKSPPTDIIPPLDEGVDTPEGEDRMIPEEGDGEDAMQRIRDFLSSPAHGFYFQSGGDDKEIRTWDYDLSRVRSLTFTPTETPEKCTKFSVKVDNKKCKLEEPLIVHVPKEPRDTPHHTFYWIKISPEGNYMYSNETTALEIVPPEPEDLNQMELWVKVDPKSLAYARDQEDVVKINPFADNCSLDEEWTIIFRLKE